MLTASLTVGSTNLVELTEFQDTTDDSYPTDATVTAQLLDGRGAPVAGVGAVTMTLVTGTSGAATIYRGTIPAAAPLVAGRVYTLVVTASDTSGNTRAFRVQATAVEG